MAQGAGKSRARSQVGHAPIAAFATIPALGKLSFHLFSATATTPRFFHRFQWREGFLENRFRLSLSLIIDDPELWPAFDRRQFADGAGKLQVFCDARDAKSGENIFEVADHQRVFCAINFFHPRHCPQFMRAGAHCHST
jgi:hypothetical protein